MENRMIKLKHNSLTRYLKCSFMTVCKLHNNVSMAKLYIYQFFTFKQQILKLSQDSLRYSIKFSNLLKVMVYCCKS